MNKLLEKLKETQTQTDIAAWAVVTKCGTLHDSLALPAGAGALYVQVALSVKTAKK
jgi:hypothetical protein